MHSIKLPKFSNSYIPKHEIKDFSYHSPTNNNINRSIWVTKYNINTQPDIQTKSSCKK